jgi:hypothetical protein
MVTQMILPGKPSDYMEEKAVENIFEEGPEKHSSHEKSPSQKKGDPAGSHSRSQETDCGCPKKKLRIEGVRSSPLHRSTLPNHFASLK